MLKKVYLVLITAFVIAVVLPVPKIDAKDLACAGQSITTRAEAIEWRYKIEDGKLYKRLYNYSTSSWVEDWILCP